MLPGMGPVSISCRSMKGRLPLAATSRASRATLNSHVAILSLFGEFEEEERCTCSEHLVVANSDPAEGRAEDLLHIMMPKSGKDLPIPAGLGELVTELDPRADDWRVGVEECLLLPQLLVGSLVKL